MEEEAVHNEQTDILSREDIFDTEEGQENDTHSEGEKSRAAGGRAQRRAALSDIENAEIAVLRREKKISIEYPSVTSCSVRLHRVYITSSKYKHLMDEMKGGVYGQPSRPDLDLQTVLLPDFEIPSVDIAFNPVKLVYVMCRRVEDIMIAYLCTNPKATLNISVSVCRFGPKEFHCINTERQKLFRRYVFTYLRPLLGTHRATAARQRIETENYTLDGPLSSDDDETRSVMSDTSSLATIKSKRSVKSHESSSSLKGKGKKELKSGKSKKKLLKKQSSKMKSL